MSTKAQQPALEKTVGKARFAGAQRRIKRQLNLIHDVDQETYIALGHAIDEAANALVQCWTDFARFVVSHVLAHKCVTNGWMDGQAPQGQRQRPRTPSTQRPLGHDGPHVTCALGIAAAGITGQVRQRGARQVLGSGLIKIL